MTTALLRGKGGRTSFSSAVVACVRVIVVEEDVREPGAFDEDCAV